jgi:hypothetical protein
MNQEDFVGGTLGGAVKDILELFFLLILLIPWLFLEVLAKIMKKDLTKVMTEISEDDTTKWSDY